MLWAQVNNFTFHYAFYVVMNWLPTYFDHMLHASLSSAGSTKMLPYLVMFVMSNAGNMGGEWLIGRGAPVAAARKTVNSVGEAHRCHTNAASAAHPQRPSCPCGDEPPRLCLLVPF